MSPQKKLYISIISFTILNILLIVFLVFPLFRAIQTNSQAFLLGKKKLILLEEEKESLEKIADVYEIYQEDLEKITNLLVDPEVPTEFISFLEREAQNSQVKLTISSLTKKIETTDPWPSLSFQLLVVGPSPSLLKFLEKLESSPYLIEILDLNAKRLTEKKPKTAETEEFTSVDTSTNLSIKVFTK